MPRLSLPLLCFGIILVQLDEGRFITKARPKKYDCSEIEKYSRENALQTSGKSVEGEVANWWKGQMPLCSRTQWSFESLADQNSEFLCWRFQFCAQLTPSNEKYWQKGTRKFYSQAIWPSFSRPSTQEGRGTWLRQRRFTLRQRRFTLSPLRHLNMGQKWTNIQFFCMIHHPTPHMRLLGKKKIV